MKEDNIIKQRSLDFAIEVVQAYKCICANKKEFVLSKQFLKSGTSIGANVHEAINAQSRNDFIAKLYISLKEASETEYWLQLLLKTNYIEEIKGKKLLNECIEIKKIIYAILKSTKEGSKK